MEGLRNKKTPCAEGRSTERRGGRREARQAEARVREAL